MFLLTMAVILLSLIFLYYTRSVIFSNQQNELRNAEAVVFNASQELILNDTPGKPLNLTQEIPYYITYLVYETGEYNLISTNDPFLPFLADSSGKIEKLFIKDYFFDGDLNILYFSKIHRVDSKDYIVSVAINIDNDSLGKVFNLLPRAIILTVIPILIVSFFILLLITKKTIKPVVKITKAAQSIRITNLDERLPLSGRGDEIDELSKTFNELFRQLKRDFDRERQFSSDVSHELNTPLTVILGQTGLLLRWGKDNPEQLEKSLNAIKQEGKSMQSIIANLLQISRIESGRIKPQFASLSIKSLFDRLSEEVQTISPDSSLNYEISSQNDSDDFTFTTDGEMLHQIMTVLISNSVKFSGGSCKITLSATQKDEKVILEELDDGPGFSEETLPHIFERFYRGDEAHTRSVSGSGLGLSIAQTLITALSGSISAKNAEPHGACFIIELPFSD
ncbi:sensor histidine kinase [Treponema sp.]|uniref:sensor histidine kinase n=1 Tax=Treponema sp. TaxID=166 RepID=UPI00388DC029